MEKTNSSEQVKDEEVEGILFKAEGHWIYLSRIDIRTENDKEKEEMVFRPKDKEVHFGKFKPKTSDPETTVALPETITESQAMIFFKTDVFFAAWQMEALLVSMLVGLDPEYHDIVAACDFFNHMRLTAIEWSFRPRLGKTGGSAIEQPRSLWYTLADYRGIFSNERLWVTAGNDVYSKSVEEFCIADVSKVSFSEENFYMLGMFDRRDAGPFLTSGVLSEEGELTNSPTIPSRYLFSAFCGACVGCHYSLAKRLARFTDYASSVMNPPMSRDTAFGAIHFVCGGALRPDHTLPTPEDHERTSCYHIMKLLVQRGADLNLSTKYWGSTPAFIATYLDHADLALKCLMSFPGVNPNIPNVNKATPLFIAVNQDHYRAVKFLLRRPDLEVNKPNIHGATPFFIACDRGAAGIVKLLYDAKNVDITIPNKHQVTPFHIACFNGHLDAVKVMWEGSRKEEINADSVNDSDNTPLCGSASQNNPEVVDYLINHCHVNLNKQNKTGGTPLFIACDKLQLAVAKVLLSNPKVDVNHRNSNGATSFYMACSHGSVELVNSFLQQRRYDLDVNGDNCNGVSPLLIAAKNGHAAVVQALLDEEKVNVNFLTTAVTSALCMAVFSGCLDVVTVILKHPRRSEMQALKPRAMQKSGTELPKNLLHYVCQITDEHLRESMLDILLADEDVVKLVNDADSSGVTPIMYAMDIVKSPSGLISVVKRFTSLPKCDLKKKDSKGKKALDRATELCNKYHWSTAAGDKAADLKNLLKF